MISIKKSLHYIIFYLYADNRIFIFKMISLPGNYNSDRIIYKQREVKYYWLYKRFFFMYMGKLQGHNKLKQF